MLDDRDDAEPSVNSRADWLDALAANSNFTGLLVDFDHFSDDLGKSSEAAGWITAWQNRQDGPPGAWWQIRWSDTGEAAVRNGRFRFLSGVFPPEGWEFIDRPLKNAKTIEMKIRPLVLSGAGLTNKPNLKGMVPLSNRQPAELPRESGHPHASELAASLVSTLKSSPAWLCIVTNANRALE